MGMIGGPRQLTMIAQGSGYRVLSTTLPRGERNLIRYDRPTLLAEIRSGLQFSRMNDGKLPDNEFWNATVDVYRQDNFLFRKLHDCDILIRMLRANDLHDARNPIVPPPVVLPPITPPSIDLPDDGVPGVCEPVVPEQPIVPEPASITLAGISLVILAVAGYRRRTRR